MAQLGKLLDKFINAPLPESSTEDDDLCKRVDEHFANTPPEEVVVKFNELVKPTYPVLQPIRANQFGWLEFILERLPDGQTIYLGGNQTVADEVSSALKLSKRTNGSVWTVKNMRDGYVMVQRGAIKQPSIMTVIEAGRKGGRIGGRRRMETLSAERRSEIAKLAAQVRWGGGTALAKELGMSRQRLWQIQQQEAGNCIICGKPRFTSTTYCEFHQKEVSARSLAKYHNKRAQ